MKKIIILFLILLGCASVSYSQTIEEEASLPPSEKNVPRKYKDVFDITSENPSFDGGSNAMFEFINSNLKYPDNQGNGVIFVKFVVEKNGSIKYVDILTNRIQNTTLKKEFEKECIRVVKLMPKWIPGKQDGKALRVFFTIPIRFHPK